MPLIVSAAHRYIFLPTDEFFHGYEKGREKKNVNQILFFKSVQFVPSDY